MNNYQKYEKEIIEILRETGRIAISKQTREPSCCEKVNCNNCIFQSGKASCSEQLKDWLSAEYKKPVMLTEFEKEVLKRALQQGYKFVARDKNKNLFFTDKFQVRESTYWRIEADANFINTSCFFKDDFNFVKWENRVPDSIEELLEEAK